MQNELKKIKRNYNKVKKLVESDLYISDVVNVGKVTEKEVINALIVVKNNIMFIPIIDNDAKIDKILEKIEDLMR